MEAWQIRNKQLNTHKTEIKKKSKIDKVEDPWIFFRIDLKVHLLGLNEWRLVSMVTRLNSRRNSLNT